MTAFGNNILAANIEPAVHLYSRDPRIEELK
jgi:hypothetical protein